MHIYKITNTVNGKIYIGQTVQSNPKMRWYSHCDYVRKGKKSHLYDSMRKHGIGNFQWEVIDQAKDIDELNQKEQHWLDHYKSIAIVYNNREAGGNKTHSAESKARMQEAQRQAHAKRRAEGRDGGWKRRDGGAMKGKAHPKKGTSGLWHMPESAKEKLRQIQLERSGTRGKTWKLVDGKRVYSEKV
jgi:group I intron endonuclease